MIKEAILYNQQFIVSLAIIVKKETEECVDVKSNRADRYRTFVGVTYNTGARSTSGGKRPLMNITYEQKKKN